MVIIIDPPLHSHYSPKYLKRHTTNKFIHTHLENQFYYLGGNTDTDGKNHLFNQL